MKGLVFDIQHFSIHDGPGIRTTVFMKGCSLDCRWCHNPESIKQKREIQTYFFKCIGCGRCFEVCPKGAHRIEDGSRIHDRSLCIGCCACADECYSGALVAVGNEMTVDEVIAEVSRDARFFKDSGGGITVSGGEPLLQADFVAKLLVECNNLDIHTAVDTAGNVPYEAIEKVLPYTDLFLFDVKAASSDTHKKFTGAGNERILDNLKRLGETGKEIRIRVPVIPEVNLHEMDDIARLLSRLGGIEVVEPLEYHSMGAGKLESLGKKDDVHVFTVPDKGKMNNVYEVFEANGLKVIRKPG